jgi:chorismate dehydratase
MQIGAVTYLNTRPLVWGLERRLQAAFGTATRLHFDYPSRLADQLAAGVLDVALIPSIEFFRSGDYQLVSNAAIACRGPVWSVRLLSRVPLEQIRTLALDEGSRTSQALVQVLLWQLYHLRPKLVPFPLDADAATVHADALLMIGDRAMHPPQGEFCEIWDLGDRWCRWSELPFVFAVWAARKDVEIGELEPLLNSARDEGCCHLDAIAAKEAGPQGLTVSDCQRYFAENLHFHLGRAELAGLDLFRQQVAALGLLRGTAERVELR